VANLLSYVLFCTAAAFDRYGNDWLRISPDLQTIQLQPGEIIPPDELARIDIAFFSADVYPNHTSSFMGAALGAANLRWMHLYNAGVDHPIFAMFQQRGVRLTTSAGSSATPIAHSVVMHLLQLCRNSTTFARQQADRQWLASDSLDLEGRTVGIVGLGAIGRDVARLLPHFGMRVIGMRRSPDGTDPCETWTTDRLHELLPLVDDLVVTAPLTPETQGLIGTAELALLRPGAHIVNVGRGPIIDESAMTDALISGHLGGAALDVFAVEPLPTDSPLWSLPNVIVIPHSAGSTPLSKHRAAEMFAANLGRYVGGEPMHNEVGPIGG
jgi:D-2-hydroxyacid dehydrogenase (NADP+)